MKATFSVILGFPCSKYCLHITSYLDGPRCGLLVGNRACKWADGSHLWTAVLASPIIIIIIFSYWPHLRSERKIKTTDVCRRNKIAGV